MRSVTPRFEITVEEAPAPQRLAPFSVALTADVDVAGDEGATGRFVLLHDPDGHSSWNGTFRIVTLVKAEIEDDIAGDALAHAVGWAWLTEALDRQECRILELGGTVTVVRSESFGGLQERPIIGHLEVRASWTPDGATAPVEMDRHLKAWLDLLATAAGLPDLPPGVATIPVQPRRP